MKIKLSEDMKKLIESLNEKDRSKLIITEETVESLDEEISNKLRDFARQEFRAKIHKKLENSRKETELLRKTHPEYFE